MKLVAACGLGLGLWSWLGWEVGTTIVAGLMGLLFALGIPFFGVYIVLKYWCPLGQPIVTTTLAGVVLFVSSSILIGIFRTEPWRTRLELVGLLGGLLIGFTMGTFYRVMDRRIPSSPRLGPSERRKAVLVNLLLATLLVILFAVSWAIPWLKWAAAGSAGLAVAGDDAGGVSVDFYGRSINRRMIRVVLDKRLASGSMEWLDVFGYKFERGDLSYDDPKPGRASDAVRRIAFHHTEVGDSVVPLLKQFTKLERLDLRETRISRACLEELRSALPTCKILYDRGD